MHLKLAEDDFECSGESNEDFYFDMKEENTHDKRK